VTLEKACFQIPDEPGQTPIPKSSGQRLNFLVKNWKEKNGVPVEEELAKGMGAPVRRGYLEDQETQTEVETGIDSPMRQAISEPENQQTHNHKIGGDHDISGMPEPPNLCGARCVQRELEAWTALASIHHINVAFDDAKSSCPSGKSMGKTLKLQGPARRTPWQEHFAGIG
jgi:hypothetical protein